MQFCAGIRWRTSDGRNRRANDRINEKKTLRETGPRGGRRRNGTQKKKVRDTRREVGTHQLNVEVSD